MPRRQALTAPTDPVEQIPIAKKKHRKRDWEKDHRGRSWFVPVSLRQQFKQTREKILSIAQKHMTTAGNVAAAFLGYALAQVRNGKLQLSARPDAARRKLALTWEEAPGERWRQEVAPPSRHKPKDEDDKKGAYINYRWSEELDKQLLALCGALVPGEAIVYLLRYAVEAYESGQLRLREEAVIVGQKVSSSW